MKRGRKRIGALPQCTRARQENSIFVRIAPVLHNLRLAIYHEKWEHVEYVIEWLKNPANYIILKRGDQVTELSELWKKLSVIPKHDWYEVRKFINWLETHGVCRAREGNKDYSVLRQVTLRDMKRLNFIRKICNVDYESGIQKIELQDVADGQLAGRLKEEHKENRSINKNIERTINYGREK